MDVLSEVLRVVRLSGAIHFLAELQHPWAFSSSSHEILAARLKLPHGSVTPFHIFIEGGCHVTSGDLPTLRVERGDVIIFPRADVHVLASELGLTPVPIKDIYSKPSKEQITVVRYGGDGDPARFICGFLHLDQLFDPLLESLPDVICVRSRSSGVLLETLDSSGRTILPIEPKREVRWWRSSLEYLIEETAAPDPGHSAVLARLTEALFVQVLRWQIRQAAGSYGGWLAGLHDAQIGRVLSLIHASPERAWTVVELSKAAAMSRAALAKRFVDLVGRSPIQYISDWRMHLARNLLRESTLSLAEIGTRLGYQSEAAFSRAFRREVGLPPAGWRHANNHSTPLQEEAEVSAPATSQDTIRMSRATREDRPGEGPPLMQTTGGRQPSSRQLSD
jgi:AraC family transcriptional regulator, alkane utilization regulator